MRRMSTPGFSTLASIIVAVIVVVGLVLLALVYGAPQQTPANVSAENANISVVQVRCTVDADCAAYCGLDAAFTPFCQATSDPKPGYCACRATAPLGTNSSDVVGSVSNTNE